MTLGDVDPGAVPSDPVFFGPPGGPDPEEMKPL